MKINVCWDEVGGVWMKTPTFCQIIEYPNYLRTQKTGSVNYLKFI
jgi:hypothetical protein